MFLNLCAGLDRIGVNYTVNDFARARGDAGLLACIVGKPFLMERQWRNPILFGAAVYSHPIDDPTLLERLPVRRVLVPGPWMAEMCQPHWGDQVASWPVGIDTDRWSPSSDKVSDVLLYDKVMWEHDKYELTLIEQIRRALRDRGLSFEEVRYGAYKEEDFRAALSRCRAMVFLCEHETQGIAYQQALSAGVPVLAWDRGGAWLDPSYYPDKVVFGPVTSVPYFDERCGDRFESVEVFPELLDEFWNKLRRESFDPRAFILEHLTLEICAKRYLGHVRDVS